MRQRTLILVFTIMASLVIGIGSIAGQSPAGQEPEAVVGGTVNYQGYVEDNGQPVNNSCDFRFGLWDAATNGTIQGSKHVINNITVTEGRFSAKLNDGGQWGSNPFTGDERWLEIEIRCGSGQYTTLSPRQEFTAVPYAQSLRPGAIVSGTTEEDAIFTVANLGEGHGIHILEAGLNGIYINETGWSGLQIDSAGTHGLLVSTAGGDGAFVGTASDDGYSVFQALDDGVSVEVAADDGLFVRNTGDAWTGCQDSGYNNGVEICNPQDYGFHTRGGFWGGLHVSDAGIYGASIHSNVTGIGVGTDGGTGVLVNSAGYNGVWVADADQFAGYFDGDVAITGTCSGCLIAMMGINVSDSSLQPGDVVSVQGIQTNAPVSGVPMLMEVAQAKDGQALVGVVSGRAELTTSPESEGATTQLVPRDEPAEPGDYVNIIIYGPVQVEASALQGAIVAGDAVTINGDGALRALQTVVVDGITLREDGSTLGIALQDLSSGDGLIWVLVNPR